ncbi:MAG: tetratricopeptide repeat protein [Elusimicrobia bacterium]|nr:tetratricopeptide repeat protein [Elusimicrobiota bacterium]
MKKITLLLLAALAAMPVLAQDIDEEARRSARQAETEKRSEKAAAEASDRKPLEGAGSVTYEDVLAQPDNVELNYRWAKKQVEAGDIKGASATLERILMVKPGLTRIRLTYAVILYRLDNMAEARRELELVKAQSSGAVRAEAEEYLARVEKRTRLTHFHGTLGVGYQYDDNRNAGPASHQRLFRGTALNLATGRATDDTSVLMLAGFGVRRDLRGPLAKALFADLNYYRAEQTNLDTLDLQAYSFAAGAEFKLGRLTVTPTALADHIRLSEETYLRTRGGRLRFDRRLNKRMAVHAIAQVLVNDHIRTTDIPTATERTGTESTLRGGASLVVAPTQRVAAEYGYQQKDARKMYIAYDRHSLALTHTWLIGGGRFLLSGLGIDRDRYAAPDLVIASAERADDRARVHLTIGQPLGFLGKLFEPMLLTAGYEYLHVNSNILNYAYTNNKVNTMLIYRWDH